MLKIYFGTLEKEVRSASQYFDVNYKTEWMNNKLNREMILDVDKSEVMADNFIQSSVLGAIPPQWLSGGVKALICMNSDESGYIFNLSNCGDNCAKWVIKIAEKKDLTVTLHHYMNFDGVENFKAYIINTDKIVESVDEYFDEYAKIISK